MKSSDISIAQIDGVCQGIRKWAIGELEAAQGVNDYETASQRSRA